MNKADLTILENAQLRLDENKKKINKGKTLQKTEFGKNIESPKASETKESLINFLKMKQAKLSKRWTVAPNLMTQTTIFTPALKGRRVLYKEWHKVRSLNNSLNGIEVAVKIWQLNQWDLTIYLALCRYAQKNEDFIAYVSVRELLEFIGRPDDGHYRKIVQKTIERLQEARLYIKFEGPDGKYIYKGTLVHDTVEKDSSQPLYAIRISKAMTAMLQVENWTYFNMAQRIALKEKEMALAFHAFLQSNRSPFWITKDELFEKWGTQYKDKRNFFRKFKNRVLIPLQKIKFIKIIQISKTNLRIDY